MLHKDFIKYSVASNGRDYNTTRKIMQQNLSHTIIFWCSHKKKKDMVMASFPECVLNHVYSGNKNGEILNLVTNHRTKMQNSQVETSTSFFPFKLQMNQL